MGSFASSTTAASNSTPTSWKEVSVRLCSIEKTRCSLATIKGRRTGRPSPHLSRPANCMVSIRKPTSPTCSQSSSISGLHRASTSSCLGVGQHSVPPIASRLNHEGDLRSRSTTKKSSHRNSVIGELLTLDLRIERIKGSEQASERSSNPPFFERLAREERANEVKFSTLPSARWISCRHSSRSAAGGASNFSASWIC